jgi:hypothetical protein
MERSAAVWRTRGARVRGAMGAHPATAGP